MILHNGPVYTMDPRLPQVRALSIAGDTIATRHSAIDTGAGRPANPAAAPAGARGGLASRTNVLLSIPMLLFMGSASHMPFPKPQNSAIFWIVALIITALVEANALYGKPGQGAAKPLATVKGTLWAGFILSAVFYIWFSIMG